MYRLYLMEVSPLLLKENQDSALLLLDTDRQEHAARIKQEKNKALCMAAGLLLAYAYKDWEELQNTTGSILCKESCNETGECFSPLQVDAAEAIDSLAGRQPVRLFKTAKGKPYLQNCSGVYFNLSHSGDYAACVIADREAGMDIQEHRSIKTQSFADRILHESERRLFTGQENSCRGAGESGLCPEQIFRIWAAKEAFTKCTGDGLTKDFKELKTDWDAGEVTDVKSGKCLRLFIQDMLKGYTVAICTE